MDDGLGRVEREGECCLIVFEGGPWGVFLYGCQARNLTGNALRLACCCRLFLSMYVVKLSLDLIMVVGLGGAGVGPTAPSPSTFSVGAWRVRWWGPRPIRRLLYPLTMVSCGVACGCHGFFLPGLSKGFLEDFKCVDIA